MLAQQLGGTAGGQASGLRVGKACPSQGAGSKDEDGILAA